MTPSSAVYGLLVNKRCDETHKFLLLRPLAAAQEGADLHMLDVTARRDVRFVADEHRA